MRTTLTLDPDIAAKAKRRAARLNKSFKEVINAVLRAGLDDILDPRRFFAFPRAQMEKPARRMNPEFSSQWIAWHAWIGDNLKE